MGQNHFSGLWSHFYPRKTPQNAVFTCVEKNKALLHYSKSGVKNLYLKKAKTSPSAKLNFADSEGDVFRFSVKYFFIHFLIFETKGIS